MMLAKKSDFFTVGYGVGDMMVIVVVAELDNLRPTSHLITANVPPQFVQ